MSNLIVFVNFDCYFYTSLEPQRIREGHWFSENREHTQAVAMVMSTTVAMTNNTNVALVMYTLWLWQSTPLPSVCNVCFKWKFTSTLILINSMKIFDFLRICKMLIVSSKECWEVSIALSVMITLEIISSFKYFV